MIQECERETRLPRITPKIGNANMPAIQSVLLSAILLIVANAAFAQQFSGQVVTMIVNYSAGGPTDVDARIVARHLPKYLQGISSIVVRNVGGAGGRIGVNQLGESTARDRLNISFLTWNPVDQIIGEPTLKVRFNDFKFITGLHPCFLCRGCFSKI